MSMVKKKKKKKGYMIKMLEMRMGRKQGNAAKGTESVSNFLNVTNLSVRSSRSSMMFPM